MGSLFSSFSDIFTGTKANILMLGLDAAGKSSLLYKLGYGDKIEFSNQFMFIPIEKLKINNFSMNILDMGGREPYRRIRLLLLSEKRDGIIFVVDSNDRERIPDLKEIVEKVVNEEMFQDIPILFLLNKMDLPNAMSNTGIIEDLKLSNIHQRWFAQQTCIIKGDGIYEGLDWILKEIKKNY